MGLLRERHDAGEGCQTLRESIRDPRVKFSSQLWSYWYFSRQAKIKKAAIAGRPELSIDSVYG